MNIARISFLRCILSKFVQSHTQSCSYLSSIHEWQDLCRFSLGQARQLSQLSWSGDYQQYQQLRCSTNSHAIYPKAHCMSNYTLQLYDSTSGRGVSHLGRCYCTPSDGDSQKKGSPHDSGDGHKVAQQQENKTQQSQPSSSSSSSPVIGPVHGGPKLYMAFTCVKCETRSLKSFTKKAYTEGVVLVRCPGCENLHLIADNLGWFSKERTNIQDIMEEKGQEATAFRFSEDGSVEMVPDITK